MKRVILATVLTLLLALGLVAPATAAWKEINLTREAQRLGITHVYADIENGSDWLVYAPVTLDPQRACTAAGAGAWRAIQTNGSTYRLLRCAPPSGSVTRDGR